MVGRDSVEADRVSRGAGEAASDIRFVAAASDDCEEGFVPNFGRTGAVAAF